MNRIPFRRILLYFGWLPILCAGLAMAFQALRITGRPPEFFAVGKVLVGTGTPPIKSGEPSVSKPPSSDIYGTQIEILESGELRRRALERVRSMNPELKEIDVEIRVTRTKGSAILNVAAVGDEGKYTRVFLSALLDEYIAFRREMIEKSLGTGMNKVIQEVLTREKQVKEKFAKLHEQTAQAGDLLLMESEEKRLAARVSGLRGEVETLEHAGSKAGDETQPGSTRQKLRAAQDELRDAESNLKKVSEQWSRIQSMKTDYERANQDYQEWKKTLDRFDATSLISSDNVAIMERPVVAVEAELDLVRPLVTAACLGGGIGFVIMLVLGLIFEPKLSGRVPPSLPPGS